MEINRDNYEQFFLDHVEGSLSPETERKLEDFLRVNPDLRPLLEDLDASPLPAEEIRNDTLKKRLKKNIHPTAHIDPDNAEEWLIRETEGLLSGEEARELEEFITFNPAYGYDRKVFRITRLQPDRSIVFPRKNRLKKKAPVIMIRRLAWAVPAAAAVVLMLIGIRLFYQSPAIEEKPGVAQTEIQTAKETGEQSEPLVIETPSEEIREMESRETPSIEALSHGAPTQEMESRETPSRNHLPSFRMTASTLTDLTIDFNPEMSASAFAPRNMEPAFIAVTREKPILAKVIKNLFSRAGSAVQENINFNSEGNREFDFWTIAEAGIKGYNSLSDRDLELMLRQDDKGKVKAYALLEDDRLVMSRSRDKN